MRTLHTTGDGLVSNQDESAYKDVVDEAGNQRWLRRTKKSFVGILVQFYFREFRAKEFFNGHGIFCQ